MGFLDFFSLWSVANLLCSCLCLFDTIVELHVVDEKIIHPHWKVKANFMCFEGLCNS